MIKRETDIIEVPSNLPFDVKQAIQKLEEAPRRDLQIIGYYLSERSVDIRNVEQLKVAIRRHLRPAGQLAVFEDDQINKAFKMAKELTDGWTIETAIKILVK